MRHGSLWLAPAPACPAPAPEPGPHRSRMNRAAVHDGLIAASSRARGHAVRWQCRELGFQWQAKGGPDHGGGHGRYAGPDGRRNLHAQTSDVCLRCASCPVLTQGGSRRWPGRCQARSRVAQGRSPWATGSRWLSRLPGQCQGTCHCWLLAPLQDHIWSCVPLAVLPLGSSRHLPEVGLMICPFTTSHFWFAPPQHVYHWMGVPLL
jgi:hypothetical protein